jgi:hypothetical protein
VADSTSGLAGRIKSMSLGALIASGALILIVGLVVGLAGGYKIEQQRTKDDIKSAKAAAKAQPKSGGAAATGAAVRLAGKVGVTAPDSVTITVDGAKTMKFATSPKTIIVKASPGTASDITKGSRVVWKPVAGQVAQAEEVVVLPANAKMGSLVVSATPDSMTFKNNAKDVTVSIQGATVLKVATAKATDITTGGKLVAQARRASNSSLSATEVIVLPSSSKFVT